MGAAESQGAYSVLDIQHPQLRNFRGLTRYDSPLMSASIAIQKPQFYQWKNQVKQFQQNSGDNSHILLPLKYKYDEGGVCSTTGELTIEYECYPKLLSAEIRDRIKDKRKFTQAELWYLLYVCVSAREALVGQGYQVGDLQPRNIFLNTDQKAKVGSILSWPGQISAYRKAVLEEGFGYLAPEDIMRLKLGAMDNKDNTEAEIFSMGLTMLSASCLQPMKDLYLVKDNTIDEELFGSRLSMFQQDRDYSDIFRAIVTNMLEVDPDQRMTQGELSQFLFKHSDNLEEKKALMFDNVGRKLQQSINGLIKKTNGGYSDASSRYSGVGTLYTISKQNTLRQNEMHQEAMPEVDKKIMRQSQPESKNIINYQLKNQDTLANPASSRSQSQKRISFSQPSTPPSESAQTPPRQAYVTGQPTNNQSKTPPKNTPPKNTPPENTPPRKIAENIVPKNTPSENIPPQSTPPTNRPSIKGASVNSPAGYAGPINFPPVGYPQGNPPPSVNYAQLNGPPVNYRPVSNPPVNIPQANSPPVSYPHGISPRGNNLQGSGIPQGNVPQGNYPQGNGPQGNGPQGNGPQGNGHPVGYPQGNGHPINYSQGNDHPVSFPQNNGHPISFSHGSGPPVHLPQVNGPPIRIPQGNNLPSNYTQIVGPPITVPNYHKPRVVPINNEPQLQSQPVYRPFQKMTNVPVITATTKKMEKPVEENNNKELRGVIIEQECESSINNLLMETKRGGFVVEMSKVERKKSPANSEVIKNEEEYSAAVAEEIKKQQQNIAKAEERLREMKNQAQLHSTQFSPSKQIKKTQEKTILQAGNSVNAISQELSKDLEQYGEQTPSQKLDELVKAQSPEPQTPKIQVEEEKKPVETQAESKAAEAQKENKPSEVQIESKPVEVEVESKPVEVESKPVEVEVESKPVDVQIKNKLEQFKKESVIHPGVKVWGVKKGTITVKEDSPLSKIKVLSADTVKVESTETVKVEANAPMVKVTNATPQPETLELKASAPESVETKEKAAEPPSQTDDYILIEEASRNTQRESEVVPEEEGQLFLYLCKTTKGSFDECWDEMMKLVISPQDYCTKVDPSKVKPLMSEHGQFTKVGPAAVRVHTNKEQGKVWMQNLPSSRCEGDLLCGVVKDASMNHYVWVNSSLRYKNKRFPSQEVIEQALTRVQSNIGSLGRDN